MLYSVYIHKRISQCITALDPYNDVGGGAVTNSWKESMRAQFLWWMPGLEPSSAIYWLSDFG